MRAELFARTQGTIGADRKAHDANGGGLGDVQVFLIRVKGEAVGEKHLGGGVRARLPYGRPSRVGIGGVGHPDAALAVDVGKIGSLQGASLGVRRQHLVAAVCVKPLHLSVADVRHNDIAVGVNADAVRHAAQFPHQRVLAVGRDAGASAALVRCPHNAVARHHGALRAVQIVAELGNVRQRQLHVVFLRRGFVG